MRSPILIKEQIELFGKVSGLVVNPEKSHIFISGVTQEMKQAILSRTHFQEGKLPVRYLGIPLISTRLKDSDYKPIIENIKRKLARWSSKALLYAGRLQLINSVIFHRQVYWSSVVYIPTSVLKEIEAMCRNFLWHGKEDSNSMALVAWQKVCMPRREGGLGIKQLRTWNRAASGRHLWVILTKTASLWSKWIHGNYLEGSNIWTHLLP